MKKQSVQQIKNEQRIQVIQQLEVVFIKGGSGMTSETEVVEFEDGGSGTAG